MDNVKEKQAKYFFVPRVGANYSEGFGGLETLVVGAYHVCYCNCEYKHLCCNINTIASMDYKCPAYKNALPALKPEDELCLHNSNIIEINSYCDDDARYPTYTAFTRYMLDCKQGLTPEQKNDFWDSVAFYNFYQCFSATDSVPDANDIEALNNNAVTALMQVIKELQPKAIYVWTKAVNDILESHLDKIPELRKESLPREHSTMYLSLFSYNYKINTTTLGDVRKYLNFAFPCRDITRTFDGEKKRVPPLEKVLLRAIKRGVFLFDNGELVVYNNRPEEEGGYILNQIKKYYSFSSWKEISLIITKYTDEGKKMNLRQVRKYNNNNEDANAAAEIDKNIFGIRKK